jgi:S1-C subfamily serine protease
MMKIMMAAAALGLVTGAQADETAPKASPVYTTYKLRNGNEVTMSESQYGIANGNWRILSPEAIAKEAANVTVLIVVQENDGSYESGTGFFFNENTVMTNYHMARNVKSITVIDANGTKFEGCTLVKGNPELDLALIHVPDAKSKAWAQLDTDSDWEQTGDKVYVYGNPDGVNGTFSDGMISACRSGKAVFQITAPVDHGSSGSPVFNQYGLVIGIVSRGTRSAQGRNNAGQVLHCLLRQQCDCLSADPRFCRRLRPSAN